MNALRLLMQQHDQIEALFKVLAKPEEEVRGERADALKKLGLLIREHARIEEQIFYPEVGERGGATLLGRSFEEHARASALLEELEKSTPGDEFQAKLRQLEDAFIQHAGDEEIDLFPEVKSLFSRDELDVLGDRMTEGLAEDNVEVEQTVSSYSGEATVDIEPSNETID